MMETKSRTRYVTLNMLAALVCQGLNLILSFVVRTIFIKTLGAEYLGINGLFSNVLTILSFAELGLGTAVLYSLYRPLSEKNEDELCALMGLYRRIYSYIIAAVLILGLIFIPFLPYLINGELTIKEDLIVIYLLYLASTISSYIFVYKKSIIIADQKNYIVLYVSQTFKVLLVIGQCLILIFTKQFVLYLLIQIFTTLAENIFCSVYANRKYPYILNKSKPLTIEVKNNIFRNVKSMALYKFGSIILNGTDNILLSSFFDVVIVGLVSNYVLLNSACNTILDNITNAFTASVGNHNAVADDKEKYQIFRRIFFITVWLYGLCTIELYTLSIPLVKIWIGEDYLLSPFIVFSILTGFYVQGVHTVESTYRVTLGYFVKGKYAPIFSSVINISLSILLLKWIGVAGVFLATPIARIFSIGIVDNHLIYKYTFKKSPIRYYVANIAFIALFVIIALIVESIISQFKIVHWIDLLFAACCIAIFYNIIMVLLFWKTSEFKSIKNSLASLIKQRKI